MSTLLTAFEVSLNAFVRSAVPLNVYMSYGSCPPIGSDEEDVVELARDLLSCFCIFLNF